jgi:hypothetical protein
VAGDHRVEVDPPCCNKSGPQRADELLEAFADLVRGLLADGDNANTAAASNAPDAVPALDQPPAVAPPG